MVHLGLEQFVLPFPSSSALASYVLKKDNVTAELIHIDAAHEYESVLEDIMLWWDLLVPGGVLLGDDIEPEAHWPGVAKAVREFSRDNNVDYEVQGHKWYIRKPAVQASDSAGMQ